jgi:hypothetical protein
MQSIPSMRSNFTPLEQAVLRSICEMYLVDKSALEAQLSTAVVVRRENTGAGFYTDFEVEREDAAIRGDGLRHGPAARVDGLEYGMGFILWLKEGYANCLEGYSYQESAVGVAFEHVGFEIQRG